MASIGVISNQILVIKHPGEEILSLPIQFTHLEGLTLLAAWHEASLGLNPALAIGLPVVR
jgi:hypothetical protein